MTTQQKCAERIYELLLHKKELEFGCEVILGKHRIEKGGIITDWNRYIIDHARTNDYGDRVSSDKEIFLARDIRFFENSMTSYLYEDLQEIKLKETDTETFEIIGQPIRFADILLAMKKSGYPIGHYYTQEILGIGTFENSKKRYNLEKDNILEQSDEFCEFLLIKLK